MRAKQAVRKPAYGKQHGKRGAKPARKTATAAKTIARLKAETARIRAEMHRLTHTRLDDLAAGDRTAALATLRARSRAVEEALRAIAEGQRIGDPA